MVMVSVRDLRVFGLVAGVAAFFVSCDGSGSAASKAKLNLDDEKHQSSYVIGRSIGSELKSMEDAIDMDIVIIGLREAYSGAEAQIPDSVLRVIDRRTKRELHNKQLQKQKQFEDEALAASLAFLEQNKSVAGVNVTASGLQYIVLKEGAGPKPTVNDTVKVHYHGTMPDGAVFDSSIGGEPVSFLVAGVIKGWTEALQLMNAGSKYKIFVPPELAYGARAARPPIGPNSALVFEIELIEINKRVNK